MGNVRRPLHPTKNASLSSHFLSFRSKKQSQMLITCPTGSQSSLKARPQRRERPQGGQIATKGQRVRQGYPMCDLQKHFLEDFSSTCVRFHGFPIISSLGYKKVIGQRHDTIEVAEANEKLVMKGFVRYCTNDVNQSHRTCCKQA